MQMEKHPVCLEENPVKMEIFFAWILIQVLAMAKKFHTLLLLEMVQEMLDIVFMVQ